MQEQKCECGADGYCQRYRRYMGGRMRELCAGVCVDPGTAAAFREQWAREAGLDAVRAASTPTRLTLRTDQAVGDAVAMTAAVYSLHRSHPGRYLTAVESPWPDVFKYNPDVTPHTSDSQPLQMHYPAIHRSNERAVHFMQGWCEHLSAALGVGIPLMTDRPRLYFPDSAPPVEDFWLVCSGGKRDFTAKLWGHTNYQQVVNSLRGQVRFIQVGAGCDDHQRLRGTEDMVGKTTLRGLFGLARRARGILCGVSLLMHVAAALDRPAVVVAGGREPVVWNAYPKQQYVHTVGALPCSDTLGNVGRACWRSRVLPLGDGSFFDRDPCQRPVGGLPECMRMITVDEVVGLIERHDRQE